ncbi:MAG: DUF1080 domain-containing protein [Rhodospirillales bacterium]
MRQLSMVMALTALAILLACQPQRRAADPDFAGRWDMTVTTANETYPSWMEVVQKDGELSVRVQERTGNVHPVAAANLDGSRLIVTVSAAAPARPAEEGRPASPARPALVWELSLENGRLTGVQKRGDQSAQLAGVRAPDLKRPAPAEWTEPEPLFNGKDLTGWEPLANTPGTKELPFRWTVRNGELVNEAKGPNIRTTRTFDDFKLHVEYFCPPGENSGIYLRGRYEAQVTAPPSSRPASRTSSRPPGAYRNPYGTVGCIYGFLGPSTPPPFTPDWQTYDITLVGRMVTVVFNGVTTIDNQEIPGITGGAIDSSEAEPGPIYLQGDHRGGIRYRNITISLPKR